MTLKELGTLAADLEIANEYAAEVAAKSIDCGTCNFDTPVIKLKATEKWLKDNFFNVMKWGKHDNTDGKTWFLLLDAKIYGQAQKRTDMAEAIASKLKEFGWQTGVYYAMD